MAVRLKSKGENSISGSNVPTSKNFYLGQIPGTGQARFVNEGYGYFYSSRQMKALSPLGPSATFALGLTECCVGLGRGKVYYFCKPFDRSMKRPGSKGPPPHLMPDSYVDLPDLLYVDFEWDEKSKQKWLNTPHSARLRLLSARNNSLHLGVPTMPITHMHERNSYVGIVLPESMATVAMYSNGSGYTFLGHIQDMSTSMTWYAASQARITLGVWKGLKTDLVPFQARSGQDIVQRLATLYQAQRPESIRFYKNIALKAIAAHNDWVAVGGYTFGYENSMGTALGEEVQIVLQQQYQQVIDQAQPAEGAVEQQLEPGPIRQPERDIGDQLRDMEQEFSAWPLDLKATRTAYNDASRAGISELSRYMIWDETWKMLSDEQKETIVTLRELTEEAADRAQALGDRDSPAGRGRDEGRRRNDSDGGSGGDDDYQPPPAPTATAPRGVQGPRQSRGGRATSRGRGGTTRSVTTPAVPNVQPRGRGRGFAGVGRGRGAGDGGAPARAS